jgi:hypothetical protein
MKSFKSRLVLSVTLLTAAVSAFVAVWMPTRPSAEALAGDMDRLLRDRAYAAFQIGHADEPAPPAVDGIAP